MTDDIRITGIDDVHDLIMSLDFDSSINRWRSKYLFRGLSNSKYHLVTSLQRNCKEKSHDLEWPLLRNFYKYAINDKPIIEQSIWYLLSIGQHHGLPTRMLDWTYSPLMALHFAVCEESPNLLSEHDCAVWAINVEEMNRLLPYDYQHKLQQENAFVFTVDMMNSLAKSLQHYDAHMHGINHDSLQQEHDAMVILEPPSIDQRIINQYSYFTIVPECISDIELFLSNNTSYTKRYVISKDIRWNIRDWLDTININERIVYPGLDGLATWLKRHYYVMSSGNK